MRLLNTRMTDQIDFVCVRPYHQVTTLAEALTIHDEKWAYCPSARSDAHLWRSCRETALEDIRSLLRELPVAQIAGAA